jgi:hypothetical protein
MRSLRFAAAALRKFWIDDIFRSALRRHPAWLLAHRRLDRSLHRGGLLNLVSDWTVQAGDELRGIQTGKPQDYVYGIGAGGPCSDSSDAAGVLMNGLPVLSIMTWAPFVSAVIIMFCARIVRCWCGSPRLRVRACRSSRRCGSTGPTTRARPGFQFNETLALVPSLGINYLLRRGRHGCAALPADVDHHLCRRVRVVDGEGARAGVLRAPAAARHRRLRRVRLARPVRLLLFYEIAVLPMYLLIGIWGSSGFVKPQGIFGAAMGRTGVGTKEYAAMKLTLYLLFGSAFILVGILALYAEGGHTFSFLMLQQVQFDPTVQRWVFLAFYIGFGILAGIWPLHTWSPDGHASAPTPSQCCTPACS